jgi:hypothetical protein
MEVKGRLYYGLIQLGFRFTSPGYPGVSHSSSLRSTVVSGGWNGPTQFPDSIRGPLGYQPRALPSELGRSPGPMFALRDIIFTVAVEYYEVQHCIGTKDSGRQCCRITKEAVDKFSFPLVTQTTHAHTPLCYITMPRLDKLPVNDSDRTAVLRHVEAYAESLISPDLATLEASFHDQATIYASFGEALQGGPIEWLYANMKQNGGITGLEYRVTLLSLTPTTAVAQVELYREHPAYEITDFLSLVKKPSSDWIIVSKIFQVYQYEL